MSGTFVPHAFNFQKWVEDNADQLKPPVNNKLMHAGVDTIVMVVGGPNTRVDFHDDPVQEFFYQIKGDMILKVVDEGQSAYQRGRSVHAAAPHAPFATAPGGGLLRAGRGITPHGGNAGRVRMVLFRVHGLYPPHRGAGEQYRRRPAAAL